MEEHMKTKKIFILPTILILILCISTVPVRAATLGKVTGIKVKQLSEEKAKLTWIPKSWAKGYEVYQKSGSGKYKKIKSTGKTALTINNLNTGQTYYFRVKAFKKSSGKKVYGKYSSSVKIIMKKILKQKLRSLLFLRNQIHTRINMLDHTGLQNRLALITFSALIWNTLLT